MSQQGSIQATVHHRPTTNDPEAWIAYWEEQGRPWRKEPEVEAERQGYLTERHLIIATIKHGVYHFKNVKLNRADVEWLLATHENGHGPVDWKDEGLRERQ